jgi:Mg2+ and Co2+ transporter CorA
MTLSILPLANWGMGTAIIIFFAVLCIGLTALVLSFVFSEKKKNDEDTFPSEKED